MGRMMLEIKKSRRRMTLLDDGCPVFVCKIALGSAPEGGKERRGDGKTPEGEYHICLVKEMGKFGRSLGLDYPGPEDGQRGLAKGIIDSETQAAIEKAHREGARPPWGSAMGGEIYIHEGGAASDWTAGCIAVDREVMDCLFPLRNHLEKVVILP